MNADGKILDFSNPEATTAMYKALAGALTSIAGIIMFWGKFAGPIRRSIRKDLDKVEQRLELLETKSQQVAGNIASLETEVKRLKEAEPIATRLALLENGSLRTQARIEAITREIEAHRTDLTKVRDKMHLHRILLENCRSRISG